MGDVASAYGAAVQAEILCGWSNDYDNVLICFDVTPLSLGIETAGGVMTKLVPRNSTIPCKANETFHISDFVGLGSVDNTNNDVLIKIYEGERQFVKDNHCLGQLELKNISPSPDGFPQIQVTFDVDANGTLHVTAKDILAPSHEVSITIDHSHGRLSADEIDRIVQNAEKYKAEDEESRKRIQAKNELGKVAYQMFKVANETIAWIKANPNAEQEEYEAKKEEITSDTEMKFIPE